MDYRLADILDLGSLKTMLNSLWVASGIPMGVIDADGEIQISVGWQRVCSEFHLKQPHLAERCVLNRLEHWPDQGQRETNDGPVEFRCESGLIDIALPIHIEQCHLGTLFLGQFFYVAPEHKLFREQALRFGFDPEYYLEMIDEVPVIPKKKVTKYLEFHASLVKLLCEAGLTKLQERKAHQELLQSEESFRSLFANARDGIAISSLDGRILEANKAVCELLGYSCGQIIGKNLEMLTDPTVHDRIQERISEVLDKESVLFESVLHSKMGEPIPIEISCSLIQFRGQQALLGSIHDLRHRKESERLIKEAERRFRLIFEAAAVGIVTTGPGGRFLQVNPQFGRFLGYASEELQGMTVLDVTAPQDRASTKELLEQSSRGELAVIDVEKRYLRKDGNEIWGRVIANHFDPGEHSGVESIAMIQDISPRKRMEEALQESEQSFRSVIDATPMGVHQYMLDDEDRLVFCGYNPAADKILGVKNAHFLGQEIHQVFPALKETDIPQKYLDVCRTGIPLHEQQFVYHEGSVHGVFEVHAFRTAPRQLTCMFTDITERIMAEEMLRSSEATLQSILSAAPMSIGLTQKRVFKWVNRWMTDLLGYPENELIGQSARMLYETDEEFERVGREKYVEVTRGRMGEVHTRWCRKDGRVIDILLRSMLIDREDPDAGVIFTGLDITELRRTVEDLRAKEQEVRLLLECSGEAIYGVDQQGNCTFVNPTCLDLLGYDEEAELLGQNCHNLFHHTRSNGTSYPEMECQIYKAFRNGDAVHVVGDIFWRRDQTSFPVEFWSHPIFKDGEIIGSVINFIDITERKRAEEKLLQALVTAQNARAQVDAILRSAADGMIVVNLAGRIILVNDAAQRLLVRSQTTLHGNRLEEILPDPVLLRRVEMTLVGEEVTDPFDLEPWSGRDGQQRIMEARIAKMSIDDEVASGAIITVRDVTRERALDKLKDEFISTAAHELRTPMTSILGYTELMLDQLSQLEKETLREFLDIVYERSNTLAMIIGDMLDLSRVQSGHLISLDVSIGDLNALLRQAVTPYRIDKAQHTFVVQTRGQAPPVIFDPNKMAQVLDNLISNAVKFSPDGGTIKVEAAYGDDDVLVSVSDEGQGMTSDQVERVFDKFFRVDSSNTALSGLGLGMTLVKGIIEAHGGQIWVESQPGIGTTVSFSLPLRHS